MCALNSRHCPSLFQVRTLEDKVSSAPNPVMRMRFSKDLVDARASLQAAESKKASAFGAAAARKDAILSQCPLGH
jgi:hypothetical protein